jgi:hypothetical protein
MPLIEDRMEKLVLAKWTAEQTWPTAEQAWPTEEPTWPTAEPTWPTVEPTWVTSELSLKSLLEPSSLKESELILEDGVLTYSGKMKSREEERGDEGVLNYSSRLKSREEERGEPCRTEISNIDYFLNKSLSELIEYCLVGSEPLPDVVLDLPPLHTELSLPQPSLNIIQHLLLDGCDPNQISPDGLPPLHTLLRADHPSSVPLLPLVELLLSSGASLELRDSLGNSPLNCLSYLLPQERSQDAAQLCELLLSYPDSYCDVNSINSAGRSLLSCSVSYLDTSAELTRILVNHGGQVWPRPAPSAPISVPALDQDREQSGFTWFLRAVVQANSLDGAENTLTCLCHEMGRDPARMKSHVMRVLLREGKHPRVLGPLYAQIRLAMTPFWSEPQQLRYLAWNSIRKSIGPKRLNRDSKHLGLPSPLRKYLTLSSSKPTE